MKELMLIVAHMMPEEEMLNQIEEALTEHKLYSSEETAMALATHCQMFVLKRMINGSDDKLKEILADMKKSEQRESLFNINPS